MSDLKKKISACRECRQSLPHEPRPVFQFSKKSRILIAGQAPGRRTHESGRPFDDPSGERLISWLGITKKQFYDEDSFAIVPMSFCFPGSRSGGDLPPLKKCAEIWRNRVMAQLSSVTLTLLVGRYAQDWHLQSKERSLTLRVREWLEQPADIIPLPHPSPRNNIWMSKNRWFEEQCLPEIRKLVVAHLS